MGVLSTVVDRGIIKLFGGGPLGYVASAGIRWFRESWADDNSVKVVTTESIRPGEQYTVIARPAPSSAERKLLAQHKKLSTKVVQLQRPNRKQRRLASKIAASQRRQAKLSAKVQPDRDSRRDRRRAKRVAALAACERTRWAKFDKVDKKAARREKAESLLGEIAAAIAAEQADALARASKNSTTKSASSRRARTRILRVEEGN